MSAPKKNYSVPEKEALAIIFACKKFRHYLLGYKIIFHTDHDSLKYLVNKADLSGRIARWVLLLQEFDYQVQVCSGKHHENIDFLSRLKGPQNPNDLVDDFPDKHIQHIEGRESLYFDILEFLTKGVLPKGLSLEAQAIFIYKAGPYTLVRGVLRKLTPNQKLKRCVEMSEVPKVISAMHTEEAGGHFAVDTTVNKIRDAGYWWPTLFRDAHNYIKRCDPCQRAGKPSGSSHWPLTPIFL